MSHFLSILHHTPRPQPYEAAEPGMKEKDWQPTLKNKGLIDWLSGNQKA